ncbi:MAG: hypothetical protein J6C33_01695 [Lachnospiraceae bacterium]|nr:hypothetical protein [Lachnospiraceae bacterium]
MGTLIIIIILAAAAIPAARACMKHIKGQGGCCGSCEACKKKQERHASKEE